MQIINKQLRYNEIMWLEKMLSQDFLYRDEIVGQINAAEIHREYKEFYLSLQFKVSNVKRGNSNIPRVPVEMHVYSHKRVPIQFLLHVIQGKVDELEIFNVDCSAIDGYLSIEGDNTEIIISKELQI